MMHAYKYPCEKRGPGLFANPLPIPELRISGWGLGQLTAKASAEAAQFLQYWSHLLHVMQKYSYM